jgi:lipopolysaccharide/colanic/teichoic acid biosynthesis glycosyltransferase
MPRWLELVLSFVAICILAPLWIGAAFLILLFDGWPIWFLHQRVGKDGKPFPVFKFRTMKVSNKGPSVTTTGDSRITRIGAILRKTKIDELPQLFNVLFGQMSFVGPRPEVEEFVAMYTAEQKKILNVRPGITDPASLYYHNESDLLAQAQDWRDAYVNQILPNKLRLSLEYLEKRNTWTDFQLILMTVGVLAKSRVIQK